MCVCERERERERVLCVSVVIGVSKVSGGRGSGGREGSVKKIRSNGMRGISVFLPSPT